MLVDDGTLGLVKAMRGLFTELDYCMAPDSLSDLAHMLGSFLSLQVWSFAYMYSRGVLFV